MNSIDAKGLNCPAPVLKVKECVELESPPTIDVIVDNAAAQQNVSRFLQNSGYRTTLITDGEDFHIKGERNGPIQTKETGSSSYSFKPEKLSDGTKKIMVMVTSDRIGHGDDILGEKLMGNFIKTLKEMGSELWRLVFVNNGVKLTILDSSVLSDLKAYEEEGIKILVCGTCLMHFDLMEKKAVGETTNMLDIVTAMQVSDQVITL